MTTPFWCLIFVALFPIVLAFVGDYYRITALGSLDNRHPRGQAAALEGPGARSYAAQANAWEALPVFTVAVVLAHLTGAAPGASATASLVFVAARIIHPILYIADLSTLRSLSFLVGLGCCIWLFVLAASA